MFKRSPRSSCSGALLGLVPTAAQAAPVAPTAVVAPDSAPTAGYDLFHHDRDDDHYRCMYRCDEHRRYDRDGRNRYHRQRYCWYQRPLGLVPGALPWLRRPPSQLAVATVQSPTTIREDSMNKGIVASALALTGSLVVGPAALAAPAGAVGGPAGTYTPQHAGHDHGKKDDGKKKDDDKKKDDHRRTGSRSTGTAMATTTATTTITITRR